MPGARREASTAPKPFSCSHPRQRSPRGPSSDSTASAPSRRAMSRHRPAPSTAAASTSAVPAIAPKSRPPTVAITWPGNSARPSAAPARTKRAGPASPAPSTQRWTAVGVTPRGSRQRTRSRRRARAGRGARRRGGGRRGGPRITYHRHRALVAWSVPILSGAPCVCASCHPPTLRAGVRSGRAQARGSGRQRGVPPRRARRRRRPRAVAADRLGLDGPAGDRRVPRRRPDRGGRRRCSLHAFARFVLEGGGTPAPVAPTERLVVGGLYRHVRNPMYVAVGATIVGQALLLGRPACSSTRRCSGSSSPRSCTATRSRRSAPATARSTRPTAAPCRPGGRGCVPGRRPTADGMRPGPAVPARVSLSSRGVRVPLLAGLAGEELHQHARVVGRVDSGDQPVETELEVAADTELPLLLGRAGDAELRGHHGEALDPAAGQAVRLLAGEDRRDAGVGRVPRVRVGLDPPLAGKAAQRRRSSVTSTFGFSVSSCGIVFCVCSSTVLVAASAWPAIGMASAAAATKPVSASPGLRLSTCMVLPPVE